METFDMAASSNPLTATKTEAGKGCFTSAKIIGSRTDVTLQACLAACYNEPECKAIHYQPGGGASTCALVKAGCTYTDADTEAGFTA